MINRKHRQELSNLIGKYLKCEIDNFTFDDGLWDLRDSDDKTVVIISEQCWYFYDVCSKHKNQDKHKFCELWETMVENWLKLLETDLEHDIPSKKWSIWDFMKNCVSFFRGDIPLFVQYPYFPFTDGEKWKIIKGYKELKIDSNHTASSNPSSPDTRA